MRSLRKNKSPIPVLKSDSTSATSDQDKAELLTLLSLVFFTSNHVSPTPSLPPIVSSEFPEHLLCTPTDICTLIAALPSTSSPGSDGITSSLQKATALSISDPLAFIFNQSLSTGIFPSIWKHSIIVPIPKFSPPSDSPTNYRPISLLSIVSKLLEKHVADILLDHFLTNSFISPNQFGFMPSRSTSDAMISVCHTILSDMDRSTPICGIFLDLKKAFDSVSHTSLLSQLFSINLPNHINFVIGLLPISLVVPNQQSCQECFFSSVRFVWCPSGVHTRSSAFHFFTSMT